MHERDPQREKFGGFVRRIAVHDPLIPCAVLINAHCDVGRLLDDALDDLKFLVVADVPIDRLGDSLRVDLGVARHLSSDDKEAVRAKRLHRNAALGVLREAGIQYRVGDLVAHFVGMSRGDTLDRIHTSGVLHKKKIN